MKESLTDIVESVRLADSASELGIVFDPSSAKKSQVPKYIQMTPELIEKARNGELSYLVDRSTGEVLRGDKAEAEIRDKVDALNKVTTTSVLLNKTTLMPKGSDTQSIQSEKLTKKCL